MIDFLLSFLIQIYFATNTDKIPKNLYSFFFSLSFQRTVINR